MNVDAIQPANLTLVGDQGRQLSSPTRGSTDRPMRETSIERPTPRKTRDAVVVPADLWPAYSCRELGGAGWAATIRRVHASTAASPSVSHRRATVGPTKRTLTTQRTPSGRRLAVPTSRPPPLAATGSFGLTCRTATGITGLRCGASCTFILSLQRHGRKKVGSLRSAICLLAADVYTMGGQGGGPRRAVRPPIDT